MSGADDLQYFLEVARATRLNEAARVLDVDQSTVGRRITALESKLGRRLFDRVSSGWQLTEAGQRLLPGAESVEAAVIAAYDPHRTMSGTLSGSIRVSATDGFGAFLIAPHLHRLTHAHPNMNVEVVTATAHNAVSERHFDVAVTLEKPTSTSVVVEPLAGYMLNLYASPDYLRQQAKITAVDDLKSHTLIWYVNTLLDVEPLRILESLPHGPKASVQISNITGHWLAARSGLGIAPLPSYIGADDERLCSILTDSFAVRRTYWLVVPRELERLPRVRAMRSFLHDTVRVHPQLEAPAAGWN